MSENVTTNKTNELLQRLIIYRRKPNIKMKNLLVSLIDRLQDEQDLTYKQFKSVIRFLERERRFQNMNRDQIVKYFSPIIQFN